MQRTTQHRATWTLAAAAVAAAAMGLAACSPGSVPGLPFPGEDSAQGQSRRADVVPPQQNPAPSPTPEATTSGPTPTAPSVSDGTLDLSNTSPPASASAQEPGPSSSSEVSPTQPPKPYGLLRVTDRGKYVDSRVPFLAGIIGEDGEVLHHYRFERMDVDFECTGPDAVAPQNGHFVRVFYILSNTKTPDGGPSIDATAHTWSYLDSTKRPYSGQIVTDAAKKCLGDGTGDDDWGSIAKPGYLTGGELIFDLPNTEGVLQQTYSSEIGGWRFPVENANTNFRSLDERAAERFRGSAP